MELYHSQISVTPSMLPARCGGITLFLLHVVMYGLMMLRSADSWTYHYSDTNMTYEKAKQWCETKYTALVAIQNKEENDYLNEVIPYNPGYYWIGIRKINNIWTWIGTQRPLIKEARNWAKDEPNNSNNNEDCVEIYIKRNGSVGMWNDISCTKQKAALCYTASCNSSSCSGHGECVESINSHRCICYEGFYGPECEHVVTCTTLTKLQNGINDCDHPNGNFSYQSSCKHSCKKGYSLIGKAETYCSGLGNWTAPMPTCTAVECSRLVESDHMNMHCSSPLGDFRYGSICNFSCNDGFLLHGAPKMQCGESGTWDGEQPTCRAIQCAAHTVPEEGDMKCTGDFGEFSYGSQCTFSCKEGFTLVGRESLNCTPAGQWTDLTPRCADVTCTALQAPELGNMTCTDIKGPFTYGSVCQFECPEGTKLNGSHKLECGSSGTWTAEFPVCEVIQCKDPTAPKHGDVKCGGILGELAYASNCTFSCQSGFILVGKETVDCTASGDWTDEAPRCEAIQCAAHLVPEEGDMKCTGDFGEFAYGSQCTFSCKEGFTLVGKESLNCTPAGQWTDHTPRCADVTCTALQAPELGNMTCTDIKGPFTYGSVCRFECPEGTKLNGSHELECGSSGTWTSEVPVCEVIQCKDPTAPKHGDVKCGGILGELAYASNCTFSCQSGFILVGEETVDCTASGDWTYEAPRCEVLRSSAAHALAPLMVLSVLIPSAAVLGAYLIKRKKVPRCLMCHKRSALAPRSDRSGSARRAVLTAWRAKGSLSLTRSNSYQPIEPWQAEENSMDFFSGVDEEEEEQNELMTLEDSTLE
ncbi:E-selectin isoform X2 [Protopterus annectens]|uniref:E-selectin isoform X2 n=1 Tax=Protopterus annectens TaxID=7888 RepID=UPI001CFB4693|nr:E-selectin isoform X2 [Protopterus annectens]